MVASLYCRFTVDSEGPGTAVFVCIMWCCLMRGNTLWIWGHALCLFEEKVHRWQKEHLRKGTLSCSVPHEAPCRPLLSPWAAEGLTDCRRGWGGGSPGLGSFGCSCGPGGHEKRTGNGHLSGGVCAVWLLSLLRAPPPWWMRGRVTRATSKSPTCWFSV